MSDRDVVHSRCPRCDTEADQPAFVHGDFRHGTDWSIFRCEPCGSTWERTTRRGQEENARRGASGPGTLAESEARGRKYFLVPELPWLRDRAKEKETEHGR